MRTSFLCFPASKCVILTLGMKFADHLYRQPEELVAKHTMMTPKRRLIDP